MKFDSPFLNVYMEAYFHAPIYSMKPRAYEELRKYSAGRIMPKYKEHPNGGDN